MNRTAFYAALRSRGNTLFGTSLSQGQVNSLELMLTEGQKRGVPLKQLSYIMATALHEVGPKLQPIRENLTYTSAKRIRQVWPSRFPTEASAAPYVRNPQSLANLVYANRLGNGNAASGDGWKFRGDGLVQLTGKANFAKFGVQPGMDLATSILVMFDGMLKGMFTGKRLDDYINGTADYYNARRIINADVTANGAHIAAKAKAFQAALEAAGYTRQAAQPLPTPSPAPKPQPARQPAPAPAQGFWATLATAIAKLFRRT